MGVSEIINKTTVLVKDNSPIILTAIGVTGTIATAYLAARASFKAAEVLEDHHEPGITKEKVKETWKLYIPSLASAAVTCTAIVCANRIGYRRTAAVAAGLALTERALDEYKDKVVQTIGKNKEKAVREEIAKDRVARDASNHPPVLVQTTGKVLLHEAYTGRFFEGTVEDVKKAVNIINRAIQQEDSQTVSDFYDLIRLPHTAISDEFGWNNGELLELEWTTCMTPEGDQPAISFDYASRPMLRPWRSFL